jgi:hypothetical protein
MGELEELLEGISRSEVSLHCVVEPALGNAGTGGDTLGSFPHDLDGLEEGIDVMRCVSRIQCETHDGAAHDVKFADRVGLGQFLVQQLEQFEDRLP